MIRKLWNYQHIEKVGIQLTNVYKNLIWNDKPKIIQEKTKDSERQIKIILGNQN